MRATMRQLSRASAAVLLCLLFAACTGEIMDPPGNNSQPDGMVVPEPDASYDANEPDFGEITMTPEECAEMGTTAGFAPMRLLTRYEYDNTIRDLLFVDAALARSEFPKENLAHGFENNAYVHVANPLSVRKYLEVAEDLSALAVAEHRAELLGCDPVGQETECGHQFVTEFMTRAFRRPLNPDELNGFIRLFDAAHTEFDFDTALELVIQAALQSPQFLYRIEFTDGGTAGEVVSVGPYEMANRLSYFLWSSMPDKDLFDAAAANELSTPAQVEAEARRMLDDPRASVARNAFYRQ